MCCIPADNKLCRLFLPGTTDGDLHGRLPALSAEHLWSDLVSATDLGCGDCRGSAGPLHRLHMLLLREYLCVSRQDGVTGNENPLTWILSSPDNVDCNINECHRQ